MNYINLFKQYKEEGLSGRYITNKHIEPLLENMSTIFEISTVGLSVKQQPIYSVKIGSGKTKIYMWSQMHGNESTTTKALFDLFNVLKEDTVFSLQVKRNFTLLCIPILNPDGAEAYTRENANAVDLNRDLYALSQPESQLLRKVYNEFRPHYCFNLHDQRTIYAAGNTNNPATVAFLAPAYNENRDINEVRRKAMNVIVAMNNELQKHIPNQVGRFDDAFNINCAGETFQSLNTPTILFESGHFPKDYQREETRKYIFVSLVTGLQAINENVIVDDEIQNYLNIPQNNSIFFDFIYKKVKISCDSLFLIINFAAQYEEILVDDDIVFEARIAQIGELDGYYGHQEYNCEEAIYSDDFNNIPEIDKKVNFYLNKSTKIVNGLINL
jgi:Zinc carboxypeptidase